MNRIFLPQVFTTVDQTTRKYIFQAFTSVYLAHYKWPERHFHIIIVEIDISIPGNLVSAILILPLDFPSNPCAAYWFPCFKLAGLDPILLLLTRRPDSRKRRKSSLSVPECRFISNHTNNKLLYSTFEEHLFGDFFSFLSFVNTCGSNHTRVSASNSSRELA